MMKRRIQASRVWYWRAIQRRDSAHRHGHSTRLALETGLYLIQDAIKARGEFFRRKQRKKAA